MLAKCSFGTDIARAYLKTVKTAKQQLFLPARPSFPLEYSSIPAEKMACAERKSLAVGHSTSFQIRTGETFHIRRKRN